MDKMALFIQENLNGYNLPADTLSEIRGVLLKRFGAKFSAGLSPEGRLAMEQAAKREVESAKSLHRMRESGSKQDSKTKQTKDQREKRTKTISFTDTYDKTSSSRLDGDITDKCVNGVNIKKRDVGSKTESAFESAETKADCDIETNDNTEDINPSKLQSVEKCLVWMEIHNEAPTPSIPESSNSTNTLTAESDTEQL